MKKIIALTLSSLLCISAVGCSSKKNNNDIVGFQIKIYPKDILRIRETYPGYNFENEFEDEGITFDAFSKKESWEKKTYLMYFYYGKEKYIVIGRTNEKNLQDIVIKYKNIVLDYHTDK